MRADHRGRANNSALPACRISTHIQRIMQRQSRSYSRSNSRTQLVLRQLPLPRSHLVSPAEYSFVPITVCTGSKIAKALGTVFFVPVRVTRLRPQVSDDSCRHAHPHPFPFLSRLSLCTPFGTLPQLYIHLPNTILMPPVVDIYHPFPILEYVLLPKLL
jgi:hypothetical protein